MVEFDCLLDQISPSLIDEVSSFLYTKVVVQNNVVQKILIDKKEKKEKKLGRKFKILKIINSIKLNIGLCFED